MPSNLSLTEDQEQMKLVSWLKKQGIRFYSIPNGGHRNFHEAAKFKRTGVSPGVPDICIPFASGGFHGLYVELKRVKGGKISESQLDWIKHLRENGYYADVALGFEEAKKIVVYYLSLTYPAA